MVGYRERIKIIKDDDYDRFIGDVLTTNEYHIRSENTTTILSSNRGKILYWLFENKASKLTLTQLMPFFNKFSKKENHDTYVKLFFDLILYREFSAIEYSKLIDIFAKYNVFALVDYIHILGHRTQNIIGLLKSYPKEKYGDLTYFGYNVDSAINTKRILNDEITTVKQLKKINKETLSEPKNLTHILNNYKYDFVKYLAEIGVIVFNKETVEQICSVMNTDAVLCALDYGAKFTKTDIELLFGKKKKTSKRERRRRYWARRYAKFDDPKTYDDNMEKILTKFYEGNSLKLTGLKTIWNNLLKNNCIKTITKLINLGNKPIFDGDLVLSGIKKAVLEDDINTLEKYVECKIIKPTDLTKLSQLVDLSVLYNSEKVRDYLVNKMSMKCTKIIITKYLLNSYSRSYSYRKFTSTVSDKKISFDKLLEELGKMEFPLKKDYLQEAIAYRRNDIVDYYLEKYKNERVFTNKKIINKLISQNNTALLKKLDKLDSKSGKTSKDSKGSNSKSTSKYSIDKMLEKESSSPVVRGGYRRRYRRIICQNHNLNTNTISYLIKKYNATITDKSLEYAYKKRDLLLIKYLNKIGLTFENLDIDLMPLVDLKNIYRYDVDLLLFIIENAEKLKLDTKIDDEFINKTVKFMLNRNFLSQHSYDSKKMESITNLLAKLIEKVKYKYTVDNLNSILQSHDIKLFDYFMETFDITEIDIDHLTKSILLYGCFEYHVISYITYLDNKGYDYKKYINLRNIHLYVLPSNQQSILKYVVEKLNLNMTPFSLEVYISCIEGYNYRGNTIKYILEKCNEKITQTTKDILNGHVAGDRLAYDIIINAEHKKERGISNGWRRRNRSNYHHFNFESYEVVDYKPSEEEAVNIAECKELASLKNNYYENYDFYNDQYEPEPIAGEALHDADGERIGGIINELELESDFGVDSDGDLGSDSDSESDLSSDFDSDSDSDTNESQKMVPKAKYKKVMKLN